MFRTESSRRRVLTLGLLASGFAGLVGRVFGQQTPDEKPAAPDAGPPDDERIPALRIGTVRISAVFKGYDKVKAQSEEFRTAVMARKTELMKFMDRAKGEAELLATLTPGSAAHSECEARIAKLKTEHEELRTKSEAEFTQKEAELLARLYKEVDYAVRVIAQERGLTLILRQGEDKEKGETDPKSAMSAIERWVVYADPRMDITRAVIAKLNHGG